MALSSTKSAEAEAETKEEALRAAFGDLGVGDEEWAGDTAEEIRDAALKALDIEPNELTIRILSEGSRGLMGLGAKDARVRVTIQRRTEIDPQTLLETLLGHMDIDATVSREERDGELVLNIEADDVAILIGRHGKTLDAMQYLVNSILNKSSLVKRKVVVNSGEYREKREDMLNEMAHHAARRVRATGRELTLEPMNPRDRRIVHIALREDEDVRTFSRGDRQFRAVVVAPQDSDVAD